MHEESYADRAIYPPFTSGKHSSEPVRVCVIGLSLLFPNNNRSIGSKNNSKI